MAKYETTKWFLIRPISFCNEVILRSLPFLKKHENKRYVSDPLEKCHISEISKLVYTKCGSTLHFIIAFLTILRINDSQPWITKKLFILCITICVFVIAKIEIYFQLCLGLILEPS